MIKTDPETHTGSNREQFRKDGYTQFFRLRVSDDPQERAAEYHGTADRSPLIYIQAAHLSGPFWSDLMTFAEIFRRWRIEKGYTQQQAANLLFIERTTVAKWENGSRLPDVHLFPRIAELLGVDVGSLLTSADRGIEKPAVILVDDEKIILSGGLPILQRTLPDASVSGFDKPSAALEFAKKNPVALAFLDIEMGKISGLEICKELLRINPRTNVIFLTSYIDYSFDAWTTGACGFLLKPLTAEKIRDQIPLLRYPIIC